MMRGIALPLSALVAVAAALGLLVGMRAVPPTETEIILEAAARYVAETGGAATECAGRPAPVAGVRLVVTCGADWALAVDEWGRPVVLPAVEPGT
ncbi:hypothetical protein [Roseicyclus marinus]|uniref:hypothetical protein n=1 Tax=Roseicyclus marinus TaxID=2161673 RepID=UPI00240F3606|nr:hypothetical protein [Roseicyclus marinus]MDG3040789.1 hypothetical protein [Roseicyclus marinus]